MRVNFNITVRGFTVAQLVAVTLITMLGLLSYVFAHVTGHGRLLGFLRLLDVGAEQSIPTYFSSLNLLLSSTILFIIHQYERANNSKGASYWRFLSLLFLVLSVDEAACIHENFANVYVYLARKGVITPLLETHQWLPFGLAFVLIVGVSSIPFLRLLPRGTRRGFLIAGLVFVTGALGFEFLGALMLKTGCVASRSDLAYLIRRVFEEGFEMYGIAVFNCTLYREIVNRKITMVVGGS